MGKPIPIVIDTDTGTDVDDALALVFVLASPEVELCGVTVVDGEVDVRARLVARLLGMAGRDDIPVIKGASHPLGAGRMPTWFGHEGRGCLDLDYAGPKAPILEAEAASWLSSFAEKRAYHLVAVGPLTNVALAVQRDPELPGKLHGLTVMGGMVHEQTFLPEWQRFFQDTGIHPAHMDHNTASDINAALEVARAGFEMTWVTAELTFCTPLHRHATEAFAKSNTWLGESLAKMMRIWNDEWFHFIPQFPDYPSPFPDTATACLHDPLTVSAVFPDSWLALQPHALRFQLEGELFRIIPSDDPAEATHTVSVATDQRAFEDLFVNRVRSFLSQLEPK